MATPGKCCINVCGRSLITANVWVSHANTNQTKITRLGRTIGLKIYHYLLHFAHVRRYLRCSEATLHLEFEICRNVWMCPSNAPTDLGPWDSPHHCDRGISDQNEFFFLKSNGYCVRCFDVELVVFVSFGSVRVYPLINFCQFPRLR